MFKRSIAFLCAAIILQLSEAASFAAVSYTGSTNGQVSLFQTVPNDDNSSVFIFKGLADGESSTLTFAVDSTCPMVAMAGGASFENTWSCSGGVISVSVKYKGGLSFGPASDATQGSFYLTFNDPPAAPGSGNPPADLAGIQIAVYGDVSQWNLSGAQTAQGISFGVELSGPSGSPAHFHMDLPRDAVTFLGEVLGVTVGGKAYPFATVATNGDGSVSVAVDIEKLESSAGARAAVLGKTVTKKILAGERVLGIAASKTSVKQGGSFTAALCSGKTFTAGDAATIKFLLGGKSSKALKPASLKLDAAGCASKKIKLNRSLLGKLTLQAAYKGKKATTSVKITK